MEKKRAGRVKTHRFSLMSDEELIAYCRALYEKDGFPALHFKALKQHDNLYFHLFRRGIDQRELVSRLGLSEAYLSYRRTRPLQRKGENVERWTWERIVQEARDLQSEMGFLPPAQWFRLNDRGTLVQSVYYLGRTWEELRNVLGDFASSQFVESRNGLRWRSHAEASLSNYLYARGVPHRRGKAYPDEYAEATGRRYGMYDLHFEGNAGWIDVEIWGDKPKGHNEAAYAVKRVQKEAFNVDNLLFLGIAYSDCYSDATLTDILKPYIGRIEPFVFDRPTDRVIESSHWSNADELLEFCRHLASQMPNGIFPTEEWLRKRGKYVDRDGPSYNTASVYIKTWLGGVRNVRSLLGQAGASTLQWDRESTLARWLAFWQKHGVTPSQIRHAARNGLTQFDADAISEAGRLTHAIVRYAEGAEAANASFGIVTETNHRWPRQAILDGFKQAIERWGASPNQILFDHRSGKQLLPADDYKQLAQMVDAAQRQFGGSRAVYAALGFKPPKRPRRKRRIRK